MVFTVLRISQSEDGFLGRPTDLSAVPTCKHLTEIQLQDVVEE